MQGAINESSRGGGGRFFLASAQNYDELLYKADVDMALSTGNSSSHHCTKAVAPSVVVVVVVGGVVVVVNVK
jgi:hypothetical protein